MDRGTSRRQLLVPHRLKSLQRVMSNRILTVQLKSAPIVLTRFLPLALVFIYASEVAMGKEIRVVSRRFQRFLQPGDRRFPLSLLDQIGADVVVGVSKIRIDFDRLLTIGDRLRVVPERRMGPAAECVSFGGGEGLQRVRVELDCLLVLSFLLMLEGASEILSRPLL
jgi:hypothetical protein